MEKPNFKLFQIQVCSPKLNPPIHPKKHELLRPQSWFDPTKPILSNVLILHSPKTFIPIDQTCLVFLFRTEMLIAVNYR